MSRRFPSTSLPVTNEPAEIRKGMLDLLDKINAISPAAGSASSVATVDGPTTYTVPAGISVVLVTTGASNVTVYLPEARYSVAREVEVHKVDAGAGTVTVSVSPGSIDTIGPATTFDLYAQYDFGAWLGGPLSATTYGWLTRRTNGPILAFTNTSAAAISTPASGTYYNPTGHQLVVGPGIWKIGSTGAVQMSVSAAQTYIQGIVILSTDGVGVTDRVLYSIFRTILSAANVSTLYHTWVFDEVLTLSASTTYYLMLSNSVPGGTPSTTTRGDLKTTIIEARRVG